MAFYDNIGLRYNIARWYDSLIQDKIDFVVAPTHQMAMKWLRGKDIRICPDYSDVDGKWFTMIGTKKNVLILDIMILMKMRLKQR